MTLLEPMWLPTKTVPFGPAVGKQGLRYMLQQLGDLQEGVFAAGDFDVTQRGAGANMSVDVAAGGAWIYGDDTARQGAYHLVNDATVNVAVSAAHATLPRVDQVVARIYDSTVVGGSDVPAIEVIAGTPTASAQCTDPTAANYRLGAAALPNGAVRLADVQVDAAAASIVNAKIYDRRPWARGANFTGADASGADYTNATTSYTQVNAATRMRFESAGVPTDLSWTSRIVGAAGILILAYRLNGAAVYSPVIANSDENRRLLFTTSPSAGAQVFDLWAALAGASGTATIYRTSSQLVANVREAVLQNQQNT